MQIITAETPTTQITQIMQEIQVQAEQAITQQVQAVIQTQPDVRTQIPKIPTGSGM